MSTIPPSIPPAQPSRRTLGSLLGMEPPEARPEARPVRGTGGSREIRRAHLVPVPLPLERVVARVRIVGDCAQTELQEHYRNPNDRPLHVQHTFPVAAGAAITGIEIRAGATVVRGSCQRASDAQATHERARQSGKTSALIEHVRDDLLRMQVAHVPAGAEVVVTLHIAERLRVDDGRFEYRLPTAVSPKFVPGVPVGHRGSGWSPDTSQAPDASQVTPPVQAGPGTPMDIEVTLAAGTTEIQSSVELTRTDRPDGTVQLRPSAEATCEGDFVLRVWGRADTPTLRAYTDGDRTLVVVDPPVSRHARSERIREAVYVLDCSGSMEGARIEAAKRALAQSIRSLSPRDRVQVIAFSDSFTKFRPRATEATPDTVEAAIRWLGRVEAQGGTHAADALLAACTIRVPARRVRTVLLITDGDVADDAQILDITRRMDPAVRLFCIGVGNAPSHALLSRLARLGGGTHMTIQAEGSIETDSVAFESTLAGPIACGLHEAGADGAELAAHGDLFAGRASTFFLDGSRERVRISSIDGRYSGECAVQSSPMPLGPLWARAQVEQLEDRRVSHPAMAAQLDGRIAEIGIRHQIQTRLTSFVAVDESSNVSGDPIDFVQPTDAPADLAFRARSRRVRSIEYLHRDCMCAPEGPRELTMDDCEPVRRRHSSPPVPRWYQMEDESRAMRTLHRIAAVYGVRIDGFLGENPLPDTYLTYREWRDLGLQMIGVAASPEDLRGALSFIERQYAAVSAGGAVPGIDPLAQAIATMIMLAACCSRGRPVKRLPPELKGLDLQPTGQPWVRCTAIVSAHAGPPGTAESQGLADFLHASSSRNVRAMIIAAVRALVPMRHELAPHPGK